MDRSMTLRVSRFAVTKTRGERRDRRLPVVSLFEMSQGSFEEYDRTCNPDRSRSFRIDGRGLPLRPSENRGRCTKTAGFWLESIAWPRTKSLSSLC